MWNGRGGIWEGDVDASGCVDSHDTRIVCMSIVDSGCRWLCQKEGERARGRENPKSKSGTSSLPDSTPPSLVRRRCVRER